MRDDLLAEELAFAETSSTIPMTPAGGVDSECCCVVMFQAQALSENSADDGSEHQGDKMTSVERHLLVRRPLPWSTNLYVIPSVEESTPGAILPKTALVTSAHSVH